MTEQSSPLQRYERDIASGALLPDAAQAAIVRDLDDLFFRLVQRVGRDEGVWARAQRWMGRSTAPERGLYIRGVGRGKTRPVDAFFESLPFHRKLGCTFIGLCNVAQPIDGSQERKTRWRRSPNR